MFNSQPSDLFNLRTLVKMDPLWRQYEHYVISHHRSSTTHTVYHWDDVPEEWLYDAGILHDFNTWRLERHARRTSRRVHAADRGLDGLARSDESFYGIQAKHWTHTLCARDLATFKDQVDLMRLRTPGSQGYLYTSGGRIERAEVETNQMLKRYVHVPLPMNTPPPAVSVAVDETTLPLRPYQQEAVDELTKAEGATTLETFSGSGKTVIIGHVLHRRAPRRILVMAPLKASVENLHRLRQFLPDYTDLTVDSDAGGTTDWDAVEHFWEGDQVVIYTTYASAQMLMERGLDTEDTILVVDECHNLLHGTRPLVPWVEAFDTAMLVSATVPEELFELIDCTQGPTLTLGDAIRLGYACDYRVWLPLLTEVDGAPVVDVDTAGFQPADLAAKAHFLATGMLLKGARRCIVYLASQDECRMFEVVFRRVVEDYHGGAAWTGTLIASTTGRAALLDAFQGDREGLSILCSVHILDEAIDVPRADSVFLTCISDATSELRLLQRIQRSGRLDPLAPHKVNNVFLWATEYAAVHSTLQLLRTEDVEFHTKLGVVGATYDHTATVRERVQVQVGDLKRYVEMRCVSVAERMEQKTLAVIAYYKKRLEYPKQSDPSGLGRFLNNQLSKYKRGKSHDATLIEHVAASKEAHRLERVERSDTRPTTEKAQAVIDYYKEHGEYPKQSDPSGLGRFLDNQLSQYKSGKSHDTTLIAHVAASKEAHRLERVERTDTRTPAEKAQAVIAYYKEHGEYPKQRDPSGLGMFLSDQLSKYKRGKSHDATLIAHVRRHVPGRLVRT